jgi:hypothetical protein
VLAQPPMETEVNSRSISSPMKLSTTSPADRRTGASKLPLIKTDAIRQANAERAHPGKRSSDFDQSRMTTRLPICERLECTQGANTLSFPIMGSRGAPRTSLTEWRLQPIPNTMGQSHLEDSNSRKAVNKAPAK